MTIEAPKFDDPTMRPDLTPAENRRMDKLFDTRATGAARRIVEREAKPQPELVVTKEEEPETPFQKAREDITTSLEDAGRYNAERAAAIKAERDEKIRRALSGET